MTRSHLAVLIALVLAVPAAGAAAGFFSTSPKRCFLSGSTAYLLSNTAANFTVRVDYEAAHADLHMQLVDDPAAADFVLVGDGDDNSCRDAGAVRSIRVDDAATKPDLSVALSNRPVTDGYKIYVRSTSFTAKEAAALFAVIWKAEHGREFLARR